MAQDLNNLKDRADEIKTANEAGENTALRVGGLIRDMLDYDQEQTEAISTLSSNVLKQPLSGINQMNSSPSEGQSIRFRNNRWEFFVPGEGGGGSNGRQSSYFKNVAHGTTPSLPSASDYVYADDEFVNAYGTWTSSSPNPGSNQDTWMIWVWFSGGVPLTINGPVLVRDSSTASSNGEDGESIEWVYKRVTEKLTDAEILTLQEYLEDCYGPGYDLPDVTPPGGWIDHPTGIDYNYKYEYTAFRKSSLDANGNRIWGETGFVGPILWAAYGEKGTDGDGVEYIYFANNLGYIPMGADYDPTAWTNDPNFQDPEYIRTVEGTDIQYWKDDPIDLANSDLGQGAIEWVSVRKKQTVIDSETGLPVSRWQPYSQPAVWSRLAVDGLVEGYTVDLSNQNMPVGTTFNGHAANYTNTCQITVFHNGVPMNYGTDVGEFSLSIGTITRSDAVAVNNHIRANQNFPSNPNDIRVTIDSTGIDNFDSKNAFVPITVTIYEGLNQTTTRNLIITLFGVAVGEAGKVIDLYTETAAVHTDSSGTIIAPTDLDVGVRIGTGSDYQVKLVQAALSDGYKFEYFYDDTPAVSPAENPIIQSSPFTPAPNHTSLSIRLLKRNGSNVYVPIDEERLPYVKDGAQGASLVESKPYYHADTSDDPSDITPGGSAQSGYWKETMQETGWSATNKYLWMQVKNTYTWGVDWEGNPNLYLTWVESGADGADGEDGADGYSLVVNPPNLIINELSGSTTTSKTYDNSDQKAAVQIKVGNTPQTLYISSTTPTCYKSDGTSISSNDVSATATLGNSNTEVIVKIDTIYNTTVGKTITEGYIQLTVGVSSQAPTPFAQLIKIPFYINRLESKLFEVEGELHQYVADQHYVTETVYTAGISATQKTLRSEYTEQIGKAGDYGRNLFGFHKGCNFSGSGNSYPCVPFIQGYGVAINTKYNDGGGSSRYRGRVSNLNFDNTGGLFVVKFSARAASNYGYLNVNICDTTGIRGSGSLSSDSDNVYINTTWRDCVIYFDVPDSVVQAFPSLNGWIDFEEVNNTVSSGIYIRHLFIERGNVPHDFYEADEDIAYSNQNELMNLSVASDVPYGNYSVNGTYRDCYRYSYVYNSLPIGDWAQKIQLLNSNPKISLVAGKIYTLSYWAASSVNGMRILNTFHTTNNATFITNIGEIWTSGGDGAIREGVRQIGETEVVLSTTWKQYFVRFYVVNTVSSSNLTELVVLAMTRTSSYNNTNAYIYINDIKFQEGYALEPNYFNSIITQTARRLSLVQQSGLIKAGIDIENGKITSTGDQFEWKDNDGNTVLGMDGNEAKFSGTVKAKNFYHKVLMWNTIYTLDARDEEIWYCKQADGGYGFEVGKYYSANQINTVSNGDYPDPPDDGTELDDFRGCSGSADIVVIPNTVNDTYDEEVYLPIASHYEGKIVEIIDCRDTQNISYSVGDLTVLQADSQSHLKSTFTQTNPSSSLQMNGHNEKVGGSSYRLYSDGTDWIVLTKLKPMTQTVFNAMATIYHS